MAFVSHARLSGRLGGARLRAARRLAPPAARRRPLWTAPRRTPLRRAGGSGVRGSVSLRAYFFGCKGGAALAGRCARRRSRGYGRGERWWKRWEGGASRGPRLLARGRGTMRRGRRPGAPPTIWAARSPVTLFFVCWTGGMGCSGSRIQARGRRGAALAVDHALVVEERDDAARHVLPPHPLSCPPDQEPEPPPPCDPAGVSKVD